MTFFKRLRATAFILTGLLGASIAAIAHADYPERAVRLVVGFSPGGGVDVVGRAVAEALSTELGATVIVENKTGFSGNIAAQQVKNANADGYTLLMAPTTSYALSQITLGEDKTGYDLASDFKSAGTVGLLPLVVIVNRSMGVSTLDQLVEKLKESGGQYAYGSSGNSSTEHVITELFLDATGTEMLHIPYRGSTPAMVDLIAGEIQMFMATTPTTLANMASDQLHAIGIASLERLPLLADIPTLHEQGLTDFEAASTYSILLPRDTPDEVVATLHQALNKSLDQPKLQERLMNLGVKVHASTLDESAAQLQNETTKWREAVERLQLQDD